MRLWRKLAGLPAYELIVISLASMGSKVDIDLYRMFIELTDKSKRNRRYRSDR